MDLVHYNDAPLTFDRNRAYSAQPDGEWTYEKPHGLWVSVSGDDDWPSWCRAQEFGLDHLAYAHRVTLADDNNVLVLSTVDELVGFTHRYRRGGLSNVGSSLYGGIEWDVVAAKFDGIVIAPYQWSCRYTLAWYYGWDCASGCIWNLDAITSVQPVAEAVTR